MFGYGKVPDVKGSGLTWRVRVSEVREVLEASSPTAVAEEVLSIQLFGVGLGGPRTSAFRGTKFRETRFQPSCRKVQVP